MIDVSCPKGNFSETVAKIHCWLFLTPCKIVICFQVKEPKKKKNDN